MELTPRGALAYARTTNGQRFLKYTAVSGISVVVSEVALFLALHFVRSPTWCNVIAVAVGTVPSYELNRKWAWGKSGKSHLWKEVAPFWAMSFLGLAVSTLAVYVVEEQFIDAGGAITFRQKLLVAATNLAAFGVLWIGKFLIINHVLFRHHHEALVDEPVSV